MKTTQEIFGERLNRIQKALAMEKVDRPPVVIFMDSFAAAHKGVKLADFVKDPVLSTKVIMETADDLGENLDGLTMTHMFPTAMSLVWLSHIKLPGVELGKNVIWQVDEKERMTVEDYDTIINSGWEAFFGSFCINKLDNVFSKLEPMMENAPKSVMMAVEKGYVPFCPLVPAVHPVDTICGGRTMNSFIKDLFKIPDKVEAAINITLEANNKALKQQILEFKPLTVYYGVSRAASNFLSRKLWDRFAWPSIKKTIDLIIDSGSIAYLHYDGDWLRDLEYFSDFPKGKVVWGTDGTSDIYRIKDVLGDKMCMFGDVPPALLTLSSPDEVYKYTTKLIRDMGDGFILAAGCSIPYNAKFENVKAMMEAASGK